MVDNPAGGQHAARGDNDAWAIELVEILGVGDRAAEFDVTRKEATPSVLGEIFVQAQIMDVGAVNPRRIDGHGAVDVDRDIGKLAVHDELSKDERHELSASHGEGGDQNNSASLKGLIEGLADLLVYRRMVMAAITVGRLDNHEIAGGWR